MRFSNPNIARQLLVQRSSELVGSPMRCGHDRGGLTSCVDSCVRPAGPGDAHRAIEQPPDHLFEHPLNRACCGLHLPAGEVSSVILHDELDHALRH